MRTIVNIQSLPWLSSIGLSRFSFLDYKIKKTSLEMLVTYYDHPDTPAFTAYWSGWRGKLYVIGGGEACPSVPPRITYLSLDLTSFPERKIQVMAKVPSYACDGPLTPLPLPDAEFPLFTLDLC